MNKNKSIYYHDVICICALNFKEKKKAVLPPSATNKALQDLGAPQDTDSLFGTNFAYVFVYNIFKCFFNFCFALFPVCGKIVVNTNFQ